MSLEIGILLGVGTMLLWGISDAIVRIPTKAVGAHQAVLLFQSSLPISSTRRNC